MNIDINASLFYSGFNQPLKFHFYSDKAKNDQLCNKLWAVSLVVEWKSPPIPLITSLRCVSKKYSKTEILFVTAT